MDINLLVRENIKKLAPYTTARHEFTGLASIYLDANENAFGSPFHHRFGEELENQLNRYPDPYQLKLKEKLSTIKGLPVENIFIGNGSDEAIDVLLRIFCEPTVDNVIICPPTYGMYKVCAAINNVTVKEVSLTPNYQLDLEGIEMALDANTKMIFICSPNNPTGNSIATSDIEMLINNFDGIIVIDEAYINYSKQKSFIPALTEYGNVVILQTLSKAWGLAGLRIGMAYAGKPIIDYMNKVKYPYNINAIAQTIALKAVEQLPQINQWITITVKEREKLIQELGTKNYCKKIVPSDANFILVAVDNAPQLYQYLCTQGTIVRDRSNVKLCENCLRITIGTPTENNILLQQIDSFYTN